MNSVPRAALALILALAQPVASPAASEARQARPPGASDDAELRAAVAALEPRIEEYRIGGKIPGLSVAVVVGQEPVWAKGFGYADVEGKVAAAPDTIYRIGSVTKLFTATMLMQLRDEGRLHLDEPVEKYLPEFRIGSRFADARPPTLRQVASHTAGLPREAPLPYAYETSATYPEIREVLRSLSEVETVAPAFAEYRYSNVGYAVLGAALERVAGRPYEAYVAEHITGPLGMADTVFTVPEVQRRRLAVGYDWGAKGPPTPAPYQAYAVPAGMLYSTVQDLARFMSSQFTDMPVGGRQVLGATTLREMRTPVFLSPDWTLGVGIGWHVRRLGDLTTAEHGGGTSGYSAYVMLVPEIELGVAVCMNKLSDPDTACRTIVEGLAPAVKGFLARRREAAAHVSLERWRRLTGRYRFSDPVVARLLGIQEIEIRLVDERLVVGVPNVPSAPGIVLAPSGEGVFRIQGGNYDGEVVVFEPDATGEVRRGRWRTYVFERITPAPVHSSG